MDDDRPAGEDALLLFPAEPDRPARTRVPSEGGALSEFLPEPETPGEAPGLPGREGPAWFVRHGPAWCVGAAMVLCALGVIAAAWTTRGPGPDLLQGAANERPGGVPPSDRSSIPEIQARSIASARATVRPDGPTAAPASGSQAVARSRDIESSRPAAAAGRARAEKPEQGSGQQAAEMNPPAASAPGTEILSGRALVGSRPADLIPSAGGPLVASTVEANLPTVEESGDAGGDPDGPRPTAVRSGLAETDAVRRTLEAYRTAYERLDVQAAVEVWPTVDRGGLTRAFSTLESQNVTLGECEIHVEEVTATARCQGMVRFVPTFGSRAPVNTPTGWLFRMRKSGTSWTIEDVSGAAAARTDEETSPSNQ